MPRSNLAESQSPDSDLFQTQLLEEFYDRFQRWAHQLTRGDTNRAEDLVHDLCLHLSTVRLDVTGVQNLDGYFYTILRNIYLSDLSRAAREALHAVRVEEFETLYFALSAPAGESLDRQNELRKVCAYTLWRKEQAKSACYFILRFFHGYTRQEIAALAWVPLATIDPKLNQMRAEVKLHLRQPDKLRFTQKCPPPAAPQDWRILSSPDMFQELRETILAARNGTCLPHKDLLEWYAPGRDGAVPGPLLSHLVSCEPCLRRIDNFFDRPSLRDREPLDDFHRVGSTRVKRKRDRASLLRSVLRSGAEIFEHYPRRLSIAIDGKIMASHDLHAECNRLSVRIEKPESAAFVEAFNEHGVRLLLLPILNLPPEAASQKSQRVSLSDGRWLEMTLTFDGLGLDSEVVYVDPGLAASMEETVGQEMGPPVVQGWRWPRASFIQSLRFFCLGRTWVPRTALAGLAVLLVGVLSYIGIHRSSRLPLLSAKQELQKKLAANRDALGGGTEHQQLQIEYTGDDGQKIWGTVVLWRSSNGDRYMRRLYDDHSHLMASEWMRQDGRYGQSSSIPGPQGSTNRMLLFGDLWKRDLSLSALPFILDRASSVTRTADGFAVTMPPSMGEQTPEALWIGGSLHPIEHVAYVRTGAGVYRARLVEASYERVPVSRVPRDAFAADDPGVRAHRQLSPRPLLWDSARELQISVLHRLFQTDADVNEPLQVNALPGGRVSITGVAVSDTRKRELVKSLRSLPGASLLTLSIVSATDKTALRRPPLSPSSIETHAVEQFAAPGDQLVRAQLRTHGLDGHALDEEARSFSQDALQRSQRVLQQAAALNRLALVLPSSPDTLTAQARRQWSQMASAHALALQLELSGLRRRLTGVLLHPADESTQELSSTVVNPAQFSRAAAETLRKAKALHDDIGTLLAVTDDTKGVSVNVPHTVQEVELLLSSSEAGELERCAIELDTPRRLALANDAARPGARVTKK